MSETVPVITPDTRWLDVTVSWGGGSFHVPVEARPEETVEQIVDEVLRELDIFVDERDDEDVPAAPAAALVTIDAELAADLHFLLAHPDQVGTHARAAMYASLARSVNASGSWHTALDEELPST